MTRKEAIDIIENKIQIDVRLCTDEEVEKYQEALTLALSALSLVTREQVILCKDCRYWQDNNGGYPHSECRWVSEETPDVDDYCSFAERLEEAREDGDGD